MKLKGLTKLALSGVALAAVAATLGTSTYAWYVANSTATVSNISGASKAQAAGSLLLNNLIKGSNDVIQLEDAWTNTLSFTGQTPLAIHKDTELQPVTKDKTGYTPAENATGWHDVALKPVADTDAFGYIMFGAQQTDATKTKINMTFGIDNVTAAGNKESQTVYYSAANVTPKIKGEKVENVRTAVEQQSVVAVKGTFTEDFIYALKFDVFTIAHTSTMTITEALADDTARTASYGADTFKDINLDGNYVVQDGYYSDGDAHAYYKALSTDNVSSNTIAGGEGVTDGTLTNGAMSFNLTANTPTIVVIRYWLDGADPQCFDSCIHQTFKLNLKLEAVANS